MGERGLENDNKPLTNLLLVYLLFFLLLLLLALSVVSPWSPLGRPLSVGFTAGVLLGEGLKASFTDAP